MRLTKHGHSLTPLHVEFLCAGLKIYNKLQDKNHKSREGTGRNHHLHPVPNMVVTASFSIQMFNLLTDCIYIPSTDNKDRAAVPKLQESHVLHSLRGCALATASSSIKFENFPSILWLSLEKNFCRLDAPQSLFIVDTLSNEPPTYISVHWR